MITYGTNPGMGVSINAPLPEPSQVADLMARGLNEQEKIDRAGEASSIRPLSMPEKSHRDRGTDSPQPPST